VERARGRTVVNEEPERREAAGEGDLAGERGQPGDNLRIVGVHGRRRRRDVRLDPGEQRRSRKSGPQKRWGRGGEEAAEEGGASPR
jgi:hypothetical protein